MPTHTHTHTHTLLTPKYLRCTSQSQAQLFHNICQTHTHTHTKTHHNKMSSSGMTTGSGTMKAVLPECGRRAGCGLRLSHTCQDKPPNGLRCHHPCQRPDIIMP